MFADGRLRRLLDRAIPAGHYLRDRLARFLRARFRDDGSVLPRVQPRLLFSLDMISESLAGISATEVPDPEEFKLIGRVLAGRSDDDIGRAWPRSDAHIIGRLPRLDAVQRKRARWWLRHVGAPARLVQRAEEYLSGDPALILDIAEQRQLIEDLLDGPAQWQALTLLERADHRDLAGLYADGELDRLLTEKIRGEHADRLDQFRANRLDADGRPLTPDEPPPPFSPATDQRRAGRHRTGAGTDARGSSRSLPRRSAGVPMTTSSTTSGWTRCSMSGQPGGWLASGSP